VGEVVGAYLQIHVWSSAFTRSGQTPLRGRPAKVGTELQTIAPFPPCEGLAVSKEQHYFSTLIETLEIERMSFAERLQAMELLWRSMAAEPDKLESPGWHKKILARRLAKVEAGKGEFLTLTQFKKRLQKFVGDDVRSL
jgi:putative addiction module component (TIGR02574 family)